MDDAELDRIRGVLLGTATGDALGAPYEFQPPRPAGLPVDMSGGGTLRWSAGEWTDDTAMSVAIAELAAEPADLRAADVQDRLVARWTAWAGTANDVGIQTRAVLDGLGSGAGAAARARTRAADLHRRTGRTAGNGSLMRTSPLALAYLDDAAALVAAATAVSELTHFDPDAGEACVLWTLAIRHAVRTGELDARVGLDALDPPRRAAWERRLADAEAARPADFPNNGWVVEALQAAWSAIASTPPGPDHLARALDAAVRCGNDTDTVAAIAGGLLGAAHGAAAIPPAWRAPLHGWPGLRGEDLSALAERIARS